MTESLGDILADLLDETDDVEVLANREYARDGVAFAWRPEEHVIELRLGVDIAEAAQRTPDTHVSERGAAWVRFTPSEWDEHARDRLQAWFRVAWRMAESR
jgi:hypothetical protein